MRLGWWWRSPLGTRRPVDRCWLVSLRMYVLWKRSTVLVRHAVGWLPVLEKLQACFDMHICRVQVSGSLICIKSIIGLVVARLVLETVLVAAELHELGIGLILPGCQGHTKLRRCLDSGG
jgi:hypothetical protein